MSSKKDLLLEKKRYGLKQTINQEELQLLDQNTPIQKIIGYIQMQNVKINVNKKVLIPRYETEEVILKAYQFINQKTKVLDLGCGSGIIGLAIQKNRNADVTMTDIDETAIKQSIENAKLNGINVKIFKSDLFSNINQEFDLIISNPPYIPTKNKLLDSVFKYEPHHALFAERNGNYFYQKIMDQIHNYLKTNGIIIFEISPHNLFFFKNKKINEQYFIEIFKDINQKERIAVLKQK